MVRYQWDSLTSRSARANSQERVSDNLNTHKAVDK